MLHLKMVKMVNFLLCIFYHNFFLKVTKREREGKNASLGHVSDADAGLSFSCPPPPTDHSAPGEPEVGDGL